MIKFEKVNSAPEICVIDIGSNSVRCGVIEKGAAVYKELVTTRLGDYTADGCLSDDAMARTCSAICDLKAHAAERGASKFCLFATAAVRNSQNGNEFAQVVKERVGAEVDVLSGREEAVAGLIGALCGAKDGGVIDIGGASTEIAVMKGGEVVYAQSANVGAVTAKRASDRGENPTKVITAAFDELLEVTQNSDYRAIGGTCTALAAMDLALESYDPEKVHGHILTAKRLAALEAKLSRMTATEIFAKYCVSESRSEIIYYGALILSNAMKLLDIDRVTVSESDNLEGYYFLKIAKNSD